MSKEKPNTKFFFNDKIARVIFEDDPERNIYWLEVSDLQPRLHHFHLHYFHYFLHYHYRQLPIEEWRKENSILYPFNKDGLFQFKMRWL